MGYDEGVSVGMEMFDSAAIYNAGFVSGASSVTSVHDTVMIYVDGIDPNATYKYFSTSLTDADVNLYLKSGAKFLYMGTKSSTTGKVPVRGYKP